VHAKSNDMTKTGRIRDCRLAGIADGKWSDGSPMLLSRHELCIWSQGIQSCANLQLEEKDKR
jgi:hypothetical protein